MKNKKALKIGLIATGFVLSATVPVGLVYAINSSLKSENYNNVGVSKTLKKEEYQEPKELTFEEILDSILQGETSFLDLTVNDFLKIIEWIRSEEPNPVNSQLERLAPDILEKIRKIDTEDLRLFLDIILNRGLLNLKKEEISRIEKIVLSFLDKKNAKLVSDLFKYIQIALYEGLHSLFHKDNYEFFNKYAPKLVNYLVDKIITKPQRETTPQRKRREERKVILRASLLNLIRKFLITGFSSQEELVDDLVKTIYQMTDQIPKKFDYEKKSWPKFKTSVPVDEIIKTYITNFINSLTIPSKVGINAKINKNDKEIRKTKEKVANLIKERIRIKTKIGEVENQETELNKQEFDLLKVKVNRFKSKSPYSYLMMSLGINQDHLADANNKAVISKGYVGKRYEDKENSLLAKKWYKNDYKRYWILARSLWDKYPEQNKLAKSKSEWYKKVENAWKKGVTEPPYSWFSWNPFNWGRKYEDGGGPAKNPTADPIFELIKNAYSEEVLDLIKSKSEIIKDNLKIFDDNAGKPVLSDIDSSDIDKFVEYENKIDEISELQILNQETSQKILKNEEKIESFKLKNEKLRSNPAYIYENENKITEEILKNNQFFNGKGLLNLSKLDLSNLVYKLQDLFLNIEKHHDKTLDETIDKIVSLAIENSDLDSFLKTIAKPLVKIFFSNTIKSKVNEKIQPLIKKFITPELVAKVTFIDPRKMSTIVDQIIRIGIINLSHSSFIYTTEVIKKFIEVKQLKQLTNQELFNIMLILKKGLKTLSKTARASTIKAVINLFELPESIRSWVPLIIQ